MKSYTHLETKHPDLFRVVDRDGDWQNYYHSKSGKYLRGVTSILNQGYAKGPDFYNWLANHTAEERDRILTAAGERGDKVHRVIDTVLGSGITKYQLDRSFHVYSRGTQSDEQLSNEEWDALLSWARFWNTHDPVVYTSEAPLFALSLGYAGTADCTAMLTKTCEVKACPCKELVGKIGLFDWKTSGAIRSSYWAQLGAYANADNIKDYIPKGKKIEYGAILRLGTQHKTTGGYEFKTVSGSELYDGFECFKAARRIAMVENPSFNPENIVEIPDEVMVTVTIGELDPKPAEPVKSARKRKDTASSPAAQTAKVEPASASQGPERKKNVRRK